MIAAMLAVAAGGPCLAAGRDGDETIVRLFRLLGKSTVWETVDRVPLRFNTFHPQGLVKIGPHFYLSSVETTEPPRKLDRPDERGRDRTPGRGKGHLFKFSRSGELLAHVEIREGAIYHPGGMDFDGESIWVPVAEYRPHSDSIVYRVDPAALKAAEAFRVGDHVGGVFRNTAKGVVHGVSWGSRRFYAWTAAGTELEVRDNPSHYIDYQDCRYLRPRWALCSGLNEYASGGRSFLLGGLDLIDLESGAAIHQVPVAVHPSPGRVLTHNPMDVELHGEALRFYFVPEDSPSTLYVVEPRIEPK